LGVAQLVARRLDLRTLGSRRFLVDRARLLRLGGCPRDLFGSRTCEDVRQLRLRDARARGGRGQIRARSGLFQSNQQLTGPNSIARGDEHRVDATAGVASDVDRFGVNRPAERRRRATARARQRRRQRERAREGGALLR